MSRVLRGSSRTEVSDITAPICVLVVSTCVAEACTVTVSDAPPISRAISRTTTWPMVITTSRAA